MLRDHAGVPDELRTARPETWRSKIIKVAVAISRTTRGRSLRRLGPLRPTVTMTRVGAATGSHDAAVKQTVYEWLYLFAAGEPASESDRSAYKLHCGRRFRHLGSPWGQAPRLGQAPHVPLFNGENTCPREPVAGVVR